MNRLALILLLVACCCLSCRKAPSPDLVFPSHSVAKAMLAAYDDEFESLRPDLWEAKIYLHKEQRLDHFKAADIETINSQLVMRTETGAYSKGNVISTFSLKGDFDVRFKMSVNFRRDLKMFQAGIIGCWDKKDETAALLIFEKSNRTDRADIIGVEAKGEHDSLKHRMKDVPNFNGYVRLVRHGDTVEFYLRRGTEKHWSHFDSFRTSTAPMQVFMTVRNYHRERLGNPNTPAPFTMEVDSFTVDAAEGIIESDI